MQLVSFSRVRQLGVLAFFVLTLLTSPGCSKFGKVTGTVTLIAQGKEETLRAGQLFFKGEKDSKMTEIKDDGTYSTDAPIGKCKVYVNTDYILMYKDTGEAGGGLLMPKGAKKEANGPDMGDAQGNDNRDAIKEKVKNYRELPTEYTDAEKSPISCEVHKGSQEFPVEIKADPTWKPANKGKLPATTKPIGQ